jgi:hypothetical protein
MALLKVSKIELKKCFFVNALPEPYFKYFSNSRTLNIFSKAKHHRGRTGSHFFAERTRAILCDENLF